MTRGLVIGKFMPVHRGHLALIEFAKRQCDQLIVSMSYTPNDPIDFHLRENWLKEIFKNDPQVTVEVSEDNFDNDTLPLEERTKIWASFIQRRFPKIDVLISSESYGEPFAKHLGVPHVLFDLDRQKFPVSATLIRQHPFRYWDFIPEEVRPYFVKKICLYGPESTGKSTLSRRLAEIYQTNFVPEVARELITSNEFSVEDIIRIGHAQTERIAEMTKTANKILFCDTDLITTQIYSKHYLHDVPPILLELEQQTKFDLYLLMDIDVPWVADGLRDLGNQREVMMRIFEEELIKRNVTPIRVKGNWVEREAIVCREVDRLLSD